MRCIDVARRGNGVCFDTVRAICRIHALPDLTHVCLVDSLEVFLFQAWLGPSLEDGKDFPKNVALTLGASSITPFLPWGARPRLNAAPLMMMCNPQTGQREQKLAYSTTMTAEIPTCPLPPLVRSRSAPISTQQWVLLSSSMSLLFPILLFSFPPSLPAIWSVRSPCAARPQSTDRSVFFFPFSQ